MAGLSSGLSGGSSGSGGSTKLGSFTAGSAVQTVTAGSGGSSGLTAVAFTAGYRYRIEARIIPGTAASTNNYELRPAGATTNLLGRYLIGYGSVEETNATTDGVVAGSSADNEEYIIRIEWDELAGLDRYFTVTVVQYDASVPSIELVGTYHVIWAQTPAETAMSTFVLRGSQSDSFGVGSYVAVFRDGTA